jgi:hypothetical protein
MPQNRAVSLFSAIYASLRDVGSRDLVPYPAQPAPPVESGSRQPAADWQV